MSQQQQQHQSSKRLRRRDYSSSSSHRIILLLDLDCFYAQCECVRLGYDSTVTPLAVLQWNSTLAVTYPARTAFGIQRGDGWDHIHTVSHGHCHTIHVPVLETNCNNSNSSHTSNSSTSNSSHTSNSTKPMEPSKGNINHDDCAEQEASTRHHHHHHPDGSSTRTLFQDYAHVYQLSPWQQHGLRRIELGQRRLAAHGKASIERYRLASQCIFATVLEFLEQRYYYYGGGDDDDGDGDNNDKNNKNITNNHNTIVLERASIDEFFLDVTKVCWRQSAGNHNNTDNINDNNTDTTKNGSMSPALEQQALAATKIIGENTEIGSLDDNDDVDYQRALQRGCVIAYQIRQHIRATLGFTLSAGISCNKTLAKLSASYGKPNGQAVTFPHAIPWLLQDTPIQKCRNLGGKLGARVRALLPPEAPTTVGAIAQYLSLPQLQAGLGGEAATARWVYHIARGIEDDPVRSKNESALTKSITAFKSLPFTEGHTGHLLTDITQWIRLLATEVVSRVERDAARNHRYPRGCSVQYAQPNTGHHHQNKSIRTRFPAPRWSTADKIAWLTDQVAQLVQRKEGPQFRLHRIGLCAIDFVAHATSSQAIDTYFRPSHSSSSNDAAGTTRSQPCLLTADTSLSRPASMNCSQKDSTVVKTEHSGTPVVDPSFSSSSCIDEDLRLAQKLQNQYDREHRMLERLEALPTKKRKSWSTATTNTTTTSTQVKIAPAKRKAGENSHGMGGGGGGDGGGDNDADQDSDFALAKKLQASYNRECRLLNMLDASKQVAVASKKAPEKPKTRRIDSFFVKR